MDEQKIVSHRNRLEFILNKVEAIECNEINDKKHSLEVYMSRIKWLYLPSWVAQWYEDGACGCKGRRCELYWADNHGKPNKLRETGLELDTHSTQLQTNLSLKCRKSCVSPPRCTRCSPTDLSVDRQWALDCDSRARACCGESYYATPSRWLTATFRDWPASTANTLRSKRTRK